MKKTDASLAPLLAFVEIPKQLPRFVTVPTKGAVRKRIPLEDLIRMHLSTLFPWTKVSGAFLARVTRNLDYQLLEGDVHDLMRSIEVELRDREQKFVLRLEHEKAMPDSLRSRLKSELELDSSDIYTMTQFVGGVDFREFLKLEVSPQFKDPAFNPRTHPAFASKKTMFQVVKERDVLLHHPYDSFVSVVDFVTQSANDPHVLAIKMTVYRGGGTSPIMEALIRAAERGKQVTVVVELKARFDEENNINWAKRLERAGAHVVFGFVGLKTHAKCLLVVRKEKDKLQRYIHLGTGNYNHSTAKLYTDIGHFTSKDKYTNDVANLFNLLTGFNILGTGSLPSKAVRLPEFKTLGVAPFGLREQIIQEVKREVKVHLDKGNGRVVMKMNSLTDIEVIKSLYSASKQGVKIDLIVRGVCMLRPQVKGVSENIKVRSIVDRFLEHARVFWFGNDGKPRVFLSSADMMNRNLSRRIEILWPLIDDQCIHQLTQILQIQLSDNSSAHLLKSSGLYLSSSKRTVRSQSVFIDMVRQSGVKSEEYDSSLVKQKSVKDRKNVKKARRAAKGAMKEKK